MALNNKNLNLLGINYKDNISNAQSFLNELGNPYSKILSDKNGVTSIELGAYGVPETFIVNKEKKIIKKIIGPIDNEKFNEILELIK
jgi:cytochrome c biogenesis protein CcmG/thiol:disulfide interchange protein DsbE